MASQASFYLQRMILFFFESHSALPKPHNNANGSLVSKLLGLQAKLTSGF